MSQENVEVVLGGIVDSPLRRFALIALLPLVWSLDAVATVVIQSRSSYSFGSPSPRMGP